MKQLLVDSLHSGFDEERRATQARSASSARATCDSKALPLTFYRGRGRTGTDRQEMFENITGKGWKELEPPQDETTSSQATIWRNASMYLRAGCTTWHKSSLLANMPKAVPCRGTAGVAAGMKRLKVPG